METTTQKPLLKHLADFEQALKNYTPSKKTVEILKGMPLVSLIGPTASGRNTLINLLIQSGRYHVVVSDTTRKPRSNNGVMEQNGVEYWFKSEEEFLKGLQDGVYLEAAIIHKQQVSGINSADIEAASKADKIAINEIEINGAGNLHKFKPDTLFIFLLPPSFDVWMERIRGRGDVDEAELYRRLESALTEISSALQEDYYQFVVNYEIHEAAAAVDEIANGRALDDEKQQIGKDHAEQLLVDIQLFLAAER